MTGAGHRKAGIGELKTIGSEIRSGDLGDLLKAVDSRVDVLGGYSGSAMQPYFALTMADEERWHLEIEERFADGTSVDIWCYSGCSANGNPKPVPFRIQVPGRRVDYNPTAFLATVVSNRVAGILEGIAPNALQRIPAIVDGKTGEWEVINVLPCMDCIDQKASLIQYYPADHPTKAGKPRGVIRLVLDPSRIGSHQIFRLKDWRVAIIVSNVVKTALVGVGATGIEYTHVCGVI
jgi:hypothetical protein